MRSSHLVCLMYHRIAEVARDPYSVTWEAFETQLDWLVQNNFVVEGFEGLERRLGSRDFPTSYALITFDDGYRCCLKAAQLMADRGLNGTFFLTRDFCQNNQAFLDESAVRDLARLVGVGTHGTTHSRLTQLDGARAFQELGDSKRWLEDLTGTEINFMSAPDGHWNTPLQQISLKAGYRLVGNSRERWNSAGSISRSGVVNRVAVRNYYNMKQFENIVKPDLGFYCTRLLRSGLLAVPHALLSAAQVRNITRFRQRLMDWGESRSRR